MSHHKPIGSHQPTVAYEGHKDVVSSVTFSPDSKSIASASWDKTIRIWDTHSLAPIGEPLEGHADLIYSASYSPLGNVVASGSWDHTIRLWDAATGQRIGEPLKGHTGAVNSVAFSPNGNSIATGSEDKTIRLWDVAKRNQTSKPFKGPTSCVRSLAFSPDGTHITSGTIDAAVCVWNVERGVMVIGPLTGHAYSAESVIFSLDGSRIISGSSDKSLILWDGRSGKIIGKPYEGHTDVVTSVAISPNGVYIASGSYDRTVRVWDLRNGRQMDEVFKQHRGRVNSVAFSPSSRHIVSGSSDHAAIKWDMYSMNLDIEPARRDMIGEDIVQIDQQMSMQDMFNLLLDHGCVDLSSQMNINQVTTLPVAGGGFGDIWRGELHDGTIVAIKAWRESLIEQCNYTILKRATREIYNWSKMKHNNIHQLMGVVIFKERSLGMVSEWMGNGNLHEYMRKNPNADRYHLSVQVTSGLAYMHSHGMIHGDIKASNVLVSSDGMAKLTDFGLSIMSESSVVFSSTTAKAGTIRWAAPELLLEESPKSEGSDVYALAMTILEIFTGGVPYQECKRDINVLNMVNKGILPSRPTHQFSTSPRGDQVWNLLVSCWIRDPALRPKANQVTESVRHLA
ncbi:unnamed protein product [Rhizoctonia solani]|uniref:Protein kinase domain-containing protein n=1 Tax=Rhizoctonia solani TaxID=456999 RepID=A0A8H3DIN0_9AGAM|nr:unnamed protein product [Rhizoctonia solani]